MSLYNHFSIPVPVIAYCAMHQALPSVSREEYEKTMRELHHRIAKETAAMVASYGKFRHEGINREAEKLRASLSQYLETPHGRDDAEVRRIFSESLARFSDLVRGNLGIGLKNSVEGRFILPKFGSAASASLLQRGREYLEELEFNLGAGSSGVYESSFVIEGGENLDILEHIVRDRLGIYATTHGKHIKEFGGYAYSVFNLIDQHGGDATKPFASGQLEAAIFFSKPDMKYAPFRSGLVEVMDRLSAELDIPHITVWQRKLGLGRGNEFIVRISVRDLDHLNRIVEWLWAKTEKPFVHGALIASGKLTIKELLF